jgi:hypothetical protein
MKFFGSRTWTFCFQGHWPIEHCERKLRRSLNNDTRPALKSPFCLTLMLASQLASRSAWHSSSTATLERITHGIKLQTKPKTRKQFVQDCRPGVPNLQPSSLYYVVRLSNYARCAAQNVQFFSLLSLKWKVKFFRYPVCLSVCVPPPPNNFWTNWYIFIKFSREVMPLKVTSTPYFLIPYLQPLQNGGRSHFWGGCKTCTSQHGAMQFCILIDLQRMNNF